MQVSRARVRWSERGRSCNLRVEAVQASLRRKIGAPALDATIAALPCGHGRRAARHHMLCSLASAALLDEAGDSERVRHTRAGGERPQRYRSEAAVRARWQGSADAQSSSAPTHREQCSTERRAVLDERRAVLCSAQSSQCCAGADRAVL